MLRRGLITFLSLIIINLLLFSGIPAGYNNAAAAAESRESGKLKVVVSNTDIGPIVNAIGGPYIELNELLPAGSDPHGFSLTSEAAQSLNDADMVILINSEFLHYEEDIKGDYPGKQYVDFPDYEAYGLELKDFPKYPENQHGLWLGIDNAVAIAKAVTSAFKNSSLSIYSEELEENLKSFQSGAAEMKITIETIIERSGFTGKKLVAAIPGVNYIIDNMGMEVGAVLLAEGSGFASGGELAEIEARLSDGTYVGIVCPDSMQDAKAGEISEQLAKDTGSTVYYVQFLTAELDADYFDVPFHNAMVFSEYSARTSDGSDGTIKNYLITALVIVIMIALFEAFIIYRLKIQSETYNEADGSVLFNENKKNNDENKKKQDDGG